MTEPLKVGPLTRSECRAIEAAQHAAHEHIRGALLDLLADRGLSWPAGTQARPIVEDGRDFLIFQAKENA